MFTKENIVPGKDAYEFVKKYETEFDDKQQKENFPIYSYYRKGIDWYNEYLKLTPEQQEKKLSAANSLQLKMDASAG